MQLVFNIYNETVSQNTHFCIRCRSNATLNDTHYKSIPILPAVSENMVSMLELVPV